MPVLIGNPHATVIQGIEDGIGEATIESSLHIALSEYVYAASDDKVWKALGANPYGLTVIDKGNGRPLNRTSDGGGFAVIEGFDCRPGDEALEVVHAHVSEVGRLD